MNVVHFVGCANKLMSYCVTPRPKDAMPRPFRTGDQALVRELNRSIILNQLRTHARSRADLAVITGLNKTTVSSLINELFARRFVRQKKLKYWPIRAV